MNIDTRMSVSSWDDHEKAFHNVNRLTVMCLIARHRHKYLYILTAKQFFQKYLFIESIGTTQTLDTALPE